MRRLALYALVLCMVPALTHAQYFGKNKIRYDDFDWKIYETAHFRISFYEEEEPSLEKVASYAESAYDEISRVLNYQVYKPIPIIAYATHAEFEQTNIIVNFIPEGVGAFATPIRHRMVLPLDLPNRQLQALIQHELTHIFQYEILFQGRRSRALYSRPPHWFMEGMASFFGNDEDAKDEAYMRDAALSNQVPSIASNLGGFFSYRYGHKVFEFIQDEWGDDGVRDFVMAFRGSLGGQLNRPIRRAFNRDAEEFDSEFKGWLRKKYLDYAARGMPEEFGRRFRTDQFSPSQEVSPAASPSGDIIAAFSTYKNDLDVILLGVPDRYLYRNLTKGASNDYQYLIAQMLTVGAERGRDLSFSPDGNLVAAFGRTERTRSLFLLDALKGGIARKIEIPLPVERPVTPAFSPDGRTIAFSAIQRGRSDIYLLDLESEEISNLTDDERFDTAPVFAPDGASLVYTAQAGEVGKLIRISLDDPSKREQLTFGTGIDESPAFSADGKRLYFSSDREDDVFDVYQLDLESRRLVRITYIIGMAINPVPVMTLEGERVVYETYARGRFDLYISDPNDGEFVGVEQAPSFDIDLEPYVPAVSITLDPSRVKERKRRKYFLENASTYVGVDQDNNFISNTYLGWSDNYGDRRFVVMLQSVQNYSVTRVSFINLEPRLQWGVTLFDTRYYYLWGYDPLDDRYTERQETYRSTGVAVMGQYPLSTSYRLEGSIGYFDRTQRSPLGMSGGYGQLQLATYTDNAPFVSLGIVGDTTSWQRYGAHAGNRWSANLWYAADISEGGALTRELTFDGRQYVPLTQRSELAFRLHIGVSDGNVPNSFYFGALDTLRGISYNGMTGNHTGYLNMEWRFPIIDRLDMPVFSLRDVRARVFLDVGAAWYEFDGAKYNSRGQPGFTFMSDGRLVDGISSYGFGFSFVLMGMPIHIDYAKLWDFKDGLTDTKADFWFGYQF